jgi:hypothetical protein
MSGFSANSSAGAPPPACFFIFRSAAFATRQSATAAAKTAASAGSAASTAAEHLGGGLDADHLDARGRRHAGRPGHETHPRAQRASARASAVPCAPEDRLAM